MFALARPVVLARPGARLHPDDQARLAHAVAEVLGTDVRSALVALLRPLLTAADLRALTRHCVFDHTALLLFPADHGALVVALRAHGLTTTPLVPSVVAKQRLAERYRLPPGGPDVRITHARPDRRGYPYAPEIEVFSCPAAQLPPAAQDAERRVEYERHIAIRIVHPGGVVLENVLKLLVEGAGFCPDGGGYNPHEGRRLGGTTVRYLARVSDQDPGRLERLEVKFHGEHATCPPASVEWTEAVSRLYQADTTSLEVS
jgi:hypothetical protein